MPNNKEIQDLLAPVLDAGGKPVVVESSRFEKSSRFESGKVLVVLVSQTQRLVEECRAVLARGLKVPPENIKVVMTAEKKFSKAAPIIIAVASGKGGVGKSTMAVHLALALARAGKRCGLMDADIYGPSTPTMLGVSEKPQTENKKIVPMITSGVQFMSMGLMVPPDQALVWRGPMVHSAVSQLLDDVLWDDLEVLVIDMPPGTGDAQMTLAQKQVLSGAVLVSTPQEVALADVRRAASMFNTLKVPVLGVIENMAWFEDDAGKKNFIFGAGGASAFAKERGLPLLGQVPLLPALRQASDEGKPQAAALAHPIFDSMAEKIMAAMAKSAA